ncbi:hypothetical protein B0H13DRAFT_2499871 [Mycena leptocephala]|nr:hypothetical protein B0H13DRAFT_2499871 [Mycena leptocephala]
MFDNQCKYCGNPRQQSEEPFLEAISNTSQSLLKNMQTVRQNKNDCTQLLEQTYELLNAILMVHINSDTGAELSPSVLTHIGKFTESNGQSHEDITQMQEDAEKQHKEVLDMIEALSDTTSSDGASSVWEFHSNSISMLPSQPKIFHGRDSELSKILQLFSQGTPRIAILGAGGMGKTSLAELSFIIQKLLRDIISIATQVELAALIGAHVGLKPGKDLTQQVIQYFSSSSDSVLILDNLETLWEPAESRGKIEEFLSLLTGVDHLALLITMRGAERPAKVAWTHPFLPLLKPLEQAAARQTFIDIADNTHDPKEVDKVLSLTDNMPLAISLIAHLVDSEGCSHTQSPFKNLLSLLSMLPDGLSDVELVQSKLPINNILGCKAALIGTSLAYSDEHKRLKALVPIREFSQHNGQGPTFLLQQIQNILPHPCDHRLEAYFITECIDSWGLHSISSGDTLASEALEHFKEFDDPDLKCNFYNVVASYYRMRGNTSSAAKFGRASISLASSTGNTKQHSLGLRNLAWVEWELGNYSAAQVHAKEAQRLAIISADLYGEAHALKIEAACCYKLGNHMKAMSLCIRARDLLGLCAMSGGTLDYNIMNTQAEIHRLKSEYAEARSIHISILEGTTIQDTYEYAFALLNVAEIDVLIGAPKNDVQRNCDRARKMLDTVGDVEGVAMCDVILADLYLRDRNSLAAKTVLKKCLEITLEYSQIQTFCLERLGDASCWGDVDGMSSWTVVYLVNSLKRKEKLGIFKALQSLGDIFLYQNDEHTATNLLTVALEGFIQMDVHCSRAECMLRFGDISMGHSKLLKAVEFWERARPLFERSSQAKQVQQIDERLAAISKDSLNAPVGNVEELEDDLSGIEDLDKMDMGEEKELGLIVA